VVTRWILVSLSKWVARRQIIVQAVNGDVCCISAGLRSALIRTLARKTGCSMVSIGSATGRGVHRSSELSITRWSPRAIPVCRAVPSLAASRARCRQ